MKIKNLLMQFVIFTPLTLLSTVMSLGVILSFMDPQSDMGEMMGGIGFIVVPLMAFGICFFIAKLMLRIKGKTVEYQYYDNNFEYEVRHEYGDTYSLNKTKGGLTTGTTFIVWFYLLLSPVLFFLQLISNLFAIVALFTDRVASWYGGIDYDELDFPFVQKILHFLFNFVILPSGYGTGK